MKNNSFYCVYVRVKNRKNADNMFLEFLDGINKFKDDNNRFCVDNSVIFCPSYIASNIQAVDLSDSRDKLIVCFEGNESTFTDNFIGKYKTYLESVDVGIDEYILVENISKAYSDVSVNFGVLKGI